MSRVPQVEGKRGSLKWIQLAINDHPEVLDRVILSHLDGTDPIHWKSPLRSDGFAEYRDVDFLNVLGLGHLSDVLKKFWPMRGPQWDALGIRQSGDVLLIEAKAHLPEMCSPPTQASQNSLTIIQKAFSETASAMAANPIAPWTDVFYQLANRFAHLHFLRSNGVPAWLVLVNFVGDADMKGPQHSAEWEAGYLVALHVLGIKSDAPLMRFVLHAYPDVKQFC